MNKIVNIDDYKSDNTDINYNVSTLVDYYKWMKKKHEISDKEMYQSEFLGEFIMLVLMSEIDISKPIQLRLKRLHPVIHKFISDKRIVQKMDNIKQYGYEHIGNE